MPPVHRGFLSGHGEFVSTVGTFTNGCHICEVEVDPDTGATEIIDYVAVDDFGVVINPMLVARSGQRRCHPGHRPSIA